MILPLAVFGLLGACNAPGAGTAGGAGLTSSEIARTSALEEILTRGTLRVGLEAGYVPFEMIDRKGELIGFDVALAHLMAEKLGVKLELVNTNWDGIIPSLNTGKFDIIMSGMTRTLERARAVNFSNPYFITGQTLLLSRSRADGVQAYRELDAKVRVIAVKLGTTGDFAASRLLSQAEIRRFKTEAEAALEVSSGRADAMVYDSPYVAIYARRDPERVRAILTPFTTENLAFAIRKGDPDFLSWLNLFLEEIRHDDPVESSYDKLQRTYFVDMPWLAEVGEDALK
ncbi:MAG: transporter substrate-binding domain-containing protein [Candidatus Schekmanbacteria bacterium]|nr:transporter substrate-binding domain-containing protein [Candidatus Schekmanbacteria bacterium]